MSKQRRNKLILIGGLAAVLLCAGGTGGYFMVKNNQHKSLVNEYNAEFSTIQSASAAFKSQLDTPPADAATLQGMIRFYTDMKAKNSFESQVKELNNNPKYTSLKATEKKEPQILDLDQAAAHLADRLKDMDKLQSIQQRSTNLDAEITSFAKQVNSQDNDSAKKSDDLIKRNNSLKDEMLSMVVTESFKPVQSSFVQALNSRGNAIDELRKAYNSMELYRQTAKWFDESLKYIDQALEDAQKNQDGQFDTYITRAYSNIKWAKNEREDMDKRWEEATKYKAEFDKQQASYLELIGLPQSSGSAVTLNQEVRPTIKDERATVFIHDYLYKSMMALSSNNFYIVQKYLDQDGKKYWEQFEYMEYLRSKGISEKLESVEVKSVEPVDTDNLKITTAEKYEITYGDGSRKVKTYSTVYKLKPSGESFLVNDLLSTTETESKDK
jgi:hypothetical protein